MCTIRRFLTWEHSNRGFHTVLNPSKISLMCFSVLFSSALLCSGTSEPSAAPGSLCYILTFSGDDATSSSFLCLTCPRAPVALHMIQMLNTETLKRTKTL